MSTLTSRWDMFFEEPSEDEHGWRVVSMSKPFLPRSRVEELIKNAEKISIKKQALVIHTPTDNGEKRITIQRLNHKWDSVFEMGMPKEEVVKARLNDIYKGDSHDNNAKRTN